MDFTLRRQTAEIFIEPRLPAIRFSPRRWNEATQLVDLAASAA